MKIINTLDLHANTSAASIPLALDNAISNQKIKNGDIIALNAIGGGLSWGASILKYGKPCDWRLVILCIKLKQGD